MNDDVRSPGSGSTPGPLSQQPPHGLDTDPGKFNLLCTVYMLDHRIWSIEQLPTIGLIGHILFFFFGLRSESKLNCRFELQDNVSAFKMKPLFADDWARISRWNGTPFDFVVVFFDWLHLHKHNTNMNEIRRMDILIVRTDTLLPIFFYLNRIGNGRGDMQSEFMQKMQCKNYLKRKLIQFIEINWRPPNEIALNLSDVCRVV